MTQKKQHSRTIDTSSAQKFAENLSQCLSKTVENISAEVAEVQFDDGSSYRGQVESGQRHGIGRQSFATIGDEFCGSFYRDIKCGVGVYRWANGDRFIGSVFRDVRFGYGLYETSGNGQQFFGCYRNDKRFGPGLLKYKDGEIDLGLWYNDQLVKLAVASPQKPPIIEDPENTERRNVQISGEDDIQVDSVEKDRYAIFCPLFFYGKKEQVCFESFTKNCLNWQEKSFRNSPTTGNERNSKSSKSPTILLDTYPVTVVNQSPLFVTMFRHYLLCRGFMALPFRQLLDTIWENCWPMADESGESCAVGFPVGPKRKFAIKFFELAEKGDSEKVGEMLHKKQVDPNVSDRCGTTALLLAATNWHVDTINVLLDYMADINQLNDDGVSPLTGCFSIFYTRQKFRTLLSTSSVVLVHGQAGDASEQDSLRSLKNYRLDKHNTALLWDDYAEILSDRPELLAKTVDEGYVRTQADQLAREKRMHSVFELMLRRGADASVSVRPYSALYFALICADVSMVSTLLRYGADVHWKVHGKSYLSMAVLLSGNAGVEISSLLLDALADPNDGLALHCVASRDDDVQRSSQIARLLLDHNADTSLLTEEGWSPLALAIMSGNDQIVIALLAHGADPNQPIRIGTALCVAMHTDYEFRRTTAQQKQLVDTLLDSGADLLAQVPVGSRHGNIIDFTHFIYNQDKRIAHLPYHALSNAERDVYNARKALIGHLADKQRRKALELALKSCYNCGRSQGVRLFPCSRCKLVLYCSKSCKQQAWNNFHKIECFKWCGEKEKTTGKAAHDEKRGESPTPVTNAGHDERVTVKGLMRKGGHVTVQNPQRCRSAGPVGNRSNGRPADSKAADRAKTNDRGSANYSYV